MNLQELNDAILKALTDLGLTEIEIDLKPKNTPNAHVKVFVSCQTKPATE